MTAEEIIEQIRPLGLESYKKVMFKHGAVEPFFGVKIEELKKIQKKIKKNYQLALDLFDTGIYDAMYLAGLIADDEKMSKKDLRTWMKKAHCPGLQEYTVPWVAAEGLHGWDMAMEWIESKDEGIAAGGWSTLSSLVSIKDDAELDMEALAKLLEQIPKKIHKQPNRVRYTMNGFVIAVGSYIAELSDLAIKTAEAVGDVYVDMGDTSCKVPSAPEYIEKAKKRGSLTKKRKSAKC